MKRVRVDSKNYKSCNRWVFLRYEINSFEKQKVVACRLPHSFSFFSLFIGNDCNNSSNGIVRKNTHTLRSLYLMCVWATVYRAWERHSILLAWKKSTSSNYMLLYLWHDVSVEAVLFFHFTRLKLSSLGEWHSHEKKLFTMSLPKTRIILERSSVKKACSTDTVVVEWDFEIFRHFFEVSDAVIERMT